MYWKSTIKRNNIYHFGVFMTYPPLHWPGHFLPPSHLFIHCVTFYARVIGRISSNHNLITIHNKTAQIYNITGRNICNQNDLFYAKSNKIPKQQHSTRENTLNNVMDGKGLIGSHTVTFVVVGLFCVLLSEWRTVALEWSGGNKKLHMEDV